MSARHLNISADASSNLIHIASHGWTEREDAAAKSMALHIVQYGAVPALAQGQPSDAPCTP